MTDALIEMIKEACALTNPRLFNDGLRKTLEIVQQWEAQSTVDQIIEQRNNERMCIAGQWWVKETHAEANPSEISVNWTDEDKDRLYDAIQEVVARNDTELSYAGAFEGNEMFNALKPFLRATAREIVDEETHSENCECCGDFLRMEAKADKFRKALTEIASPLAPSPDDMDSVPTYTKVIEDYTKRVAIARHALTDIEGQKP